MKRTICVVITALQILAAILCSGCQDQPAEAGKSTPNRVNSVTANPPRDIVTYELDERLVGRYEDASDAGSYFEIKPNGAIELTIRGEYGYAFFPAGMISATAYYTLSANGNEGVILSLNLMRVAEQIPDRFGLSITLVGNDPSAFERFYSTPYTGYVQFFSKTKHSEASEQSEDKVCRIPVEKNTVTKNPPINQITYELDERLVGRYESPYDPESYLEIKPDGTVNFSICTYKGYVRFSSENVLMRAYYSIKPMCWENVVLSLDLVGGADIFSFDPYLSVQFFGENPDKFQAICCKVNSTIVTLEKTTSDGTVDVAVSEREQSENVTAVDKFIVYSNHNAYRADIHEFIDEIDNQYNSEFDSAATTDEFVNVQNKYISIWKEETEKSIEELKNSISENDFADFVSAQENWEQGMLKTTKSDQQILQNMDNGVAVGSSFQWMWLSNIRNQYRERAIHIKYMTLLIHS